MKVIKILSDKQEEVKLELMQSKKGYWCRYGFAATEVFENMDEAIKAGWEMKKFLDEH